MIEQTISIERIEDVIDIFGSFDENIKLIEHELDVSVVSRDDQLKISGEAENVLYAVKAVQGLLGLAGRKETITEQNVRYIINLVKAGNEEHINDIARDVLCVTAKGKPIKPKTLGQKRYVDAIKKNTITLGIGPAGTGKTYLAVAAAVAAFRDKQVNRIILTRPAVEAGERLASCPAICRARWTPICGPCTTPSSTCWGRRPITNTWSGAASRWPPWPTCGAAPWTTPSSFWTRLRTPPGSR